jgi:hypothetical protein
MTRTATTRTAKAFALSLLLGAVSSSALAGGDETDLTAALRAYGEQAGFISASVPLCGGDEKEVVYFEEQVRGLLTKAGGSEDDWKVVKASIDTTRPAANPSPIVCEEELGRKEAEKLMGRLKAITKALKKD